MLEDVLHGNSKILVTPTARLSRHLRREFDRQQRQFGRSLWESPDILPLKGWLERTWENIALHDPHGTPILLEASQEEALWEEAIRSTRRDDALLNVHQTAITAARAWDLMHQWALPFKAADFESADDTAAFFDWATKIQDQLKANGWITSSQLYAAILERMGRGDLPITTTFEHTGFYEPAPAESRLLNGLKAAEVSQPFVKDARVHCFRPHDQVAEWTAAAAWARDQLMSDPSVRICVAIPGLRAAATVVERIFDDALHPAYSLTAPSTRSAVSLSAGRRLSETPLVAGALLLLGLANHVTLAEALMLSRSPFVPITPSDRLRLDSELRRQGTDKVSIRLAVVRSVFRNYSLEADKIPAKQSPSRWSATFSNLLKAAGWGNGEKLSDDEHAAPREWKDVLSRFARLGTVLPALPLHQALERVRQLASNAFLAAPDDNAPVQIMDLQDLPGMRFDALWVSGLDAATWPRPVQLNPFLPARLQRTVSMPRSSPEVEFLRAQRLQSEWERSAREVVFSSAEQARDEQLLVSPFIRDIALLEPSGFSGLSQRVFVAAPQMETIPATKPAELPRNTLQHGGVKILENQAACPFKAFATHRLSAQEIGEIPFGVSPMERGSAAHEALHEFWDGLKSKEALLSCSPEQLEILIDGAIGRALDKQLARRNGTGMEQFRALEAGRLKRVLKEWLNLERKRSDFTVVQTEVKEPVSIGGILLNVRTDRIDRLADGTHAIIDYKTGNGDLTPNVWEGPRMDQPQLPLYAVTHEKLKVSEITFGKLNSDGVEMVTENCSAEELSEWREHLEALADQYLSGHAAVDPKYSQKTCSLCGLGPLCRVAETGAVAKEEADE